MRLRPFLLSCAISFLGWIAPQSLHGQDLGNVGLRTVDANLTGTGGPVACTGSEQDYTTGTTTGFSNLGQVSHAAYLLSTNITSGTMTIQGSMDGVKFQPISEVATVAGSFANTPNSFVVGSGRYTLLRVAVTCFPATTGTYTLRYAGSNATPGALFGSQQLTQYDKTITDGASAGASQSLTFQPPFGNTNGLFVFTYAGGTPPTGSTIRIRCTTPATQAISLYTAFTSSALTAVVATLQTISVPATPCPIMEVDYLTGGASTSTVFLDYVFLLPGVSATGSSAPSANVNLVDVSGAAITLGQTTMSASLPVAIASNQSPIPVTFSASTSEGVIQPATTFNSESTSAAATALTTSIAASGATRVYLYGVTVRCSAGNASVTVKDGVGGTVIWSSDPAFAGTSSNGIAWTSAPLATSAGNGMDIVLGSCGAGNVGTLDVQASRL
jgi:hypothetical protein